MKASKLILMACTGLLLFNGCKARKVLTTRVDSTVVASTNKIVNTEETKVDTSKKVVEKTIVSKDSTTTTIEATPAAGKAVTINNDGTVTGDFTHIKFTIKKKVDTKLSEKTTEQKHVIEAKKVDSLVKTKQTTKLSKKVKAVDAKSKPGIWPLVIPIVILGALLILLWWFFGRPKGSK